MSPVKYFHQGHTHWHKSKTWFMYNEKRYYVDLVLNRRNNNIRRKMTQQVCKILFLQSKLSGLKAPGFIFLNWFFTRRVWQHHNWIFSEGTFPKKIPTTCIVNSSSTLSDAEVWTLSWKNLFVDLADLRFPIDFPVMKKGRFCLLDPFNHHPLVFAVKNQKAEKK